MLPRRTRFWNKRDRRKGKKKRQLQKRSNGDLVEGRITSEAATATTKKFGG
ncbi:hypothetical protein A2U01_0098916 [Trifolium medium]|nr:hypothetical protein [Trifolium medium]